MQSLADSSPDVDWTDASRRYVQHLVERDRESAAEVVHDLLQSGADLRDVYLELFQTSQREIGDLWQLDRITVAQEHYCTAVTRRIMTGLYPHVFSAPRGGRAMVMACAGGELHELGARVVADFFELEGWETTFLGANTPPSAIVTELHDTEAGLLALSAALPDKVQGIADIIREVRSADLRDELAVIVGGRPFTIDPGLAREVGADGTAEDARAAVRLADHLVPVGTR